MTTIRRRCERCRGWARCSIRMSNGSSSLRPDLVLVYGSQTDLMTQLTRARCHIFEYRARAAWPASRRRIRALGQRIGQARAGRAVARGHRAAARGASRAHGGTIEAPHAARLRPRTRIAPQHLRQRRTRIPARDARSRGRRQRLRRHPGRIGAGLERDDSDPRAGRDHRNALQPTSSTRRPSATGNRHRGGRWPAFPPCAPAASTADRRIASPCRGRGVADRRRSDGARAPPRGVNEDPRQLVHRQGLGLDAAHAAAATSGRRSRGC